MCEDCSASLTLWDWDGYQQDCEGCMVRALAKSDTGVHKDFYEQHLAGTGAVGVLALNEAIARERARIGDFRMSQPKRWWQIEI